MSNNVAITNAAKEKYLREIHDEFKRISAKRKVDISACGEPNLQDNESLIQHLRRLSKLFSVCDDPCPGGACPPCDGWVSSDYDGYLQKLRGL